MADVGQFAQRTTALTFLCRQSPTNSSSPVKMRIFLSVAAGIAISAFSGSFSSARADGPDNSLKVVIVRHGEKPHHGDNLSCTGINRSLQLPKVLNAKFGVPSYTYVPKLGLGDSTLHSRMFQTVTPMAVKYNLTINSKFDEKDTSHTAQDVMTKTNTVLMVWEHSVIPDLARSLGVGDPPGWDGSDFDSIWIITYLNGKATLKFDKEGLTPSADCPF